RLVTPGKTSSLPRTPFRVPSSPVPTQLRSLTSPRAKGTLPRHLCCLRLRHPPARCCRYRRATHLWTQRLTTTTPCAATVLKRNAASQTPAAGLTHPGTSTKKKRLGHAKPSDSEDFSDSLVF
ncbi:unnamed protein product, partial [Ixodes pacificus]